MQAGKFESPLKARFFFVNLVLLKTFNNIIKEIMNRFKFSFYFLTLFLISFLSTQCNSQTEEKKFAVSILNTPVLNTSDYASVFGGPSGTAVKLDSKGLIREMEFIAFPNTVFEILEVIPKDGYD